LLDAIPYTPMTYSLLIGYYLGDGYIATHANGTQRLRIFFDDAYPNIAREGADAIHIVGGHPARLAYPHPGSSHCLEASAYSKHWSCAFPQHGPGMKHTRGIALVDWQLEIVDEFPQQFVRGLLMSDGCRVLNRVQKRKYAYPRYMFSNKSMDIHALLRRSLDLMDIEWNQSRGDVTSIARKASVAKLDEFVGPKS
jgi:hypothetical protein